MSKPGYSPSKGGCRECRHHRTMHRWEMVSHRAHPSMSKLGKCSGKDCECQGFVGKDEFTPKETNARRFALIELEMKRDLTPAETEELAALSAHMDAIVDAVAPLPSAPDPSVYFPGHGRVCYSLVRDADDDGLASLEAWWAETKCSVFPCKQGLERWADDGWRAAGTRKGYLNLRDAALAAITNAVRSDA